MTRSLQELSQYLAGGWAFNNNFSDTSGNGNNGIPTNVVWGTSTRGLKPKMSSSGSISCGNDDSLKILGDSVSLSAWVLTKSLPSDIITKFAGGTPGQRSFSMSVTSGGIINLRISNDGESTGLVQTNSVTNIHDSHWHLIQCVYNGVDMRIYLDGALDNTPIAQTGDIFQSTSNFFIHSGQVYGTNDIIVDDVRVYTSAFTSAEALALYNATSAQTGVRVAEISYQHDPLGAIPEQTGEVLRIGGKLAGDPVDTISDRALSNDATIHGAMPADDNYFIGGRRLDGVDDFMNCGNDVSLEISNTITIEALVFPTVDDSFGGIITKNVDSNFQLLVKSTGFYEFFVKGTSGNITNDSRQQITVNKIEHIVGVFEPTDGIYLYKDGVSSFVSNGVSDILTSSSNLFIGKYAGFWFEGNIIFVRILNVGLTSAEVISSFNTLAALPIFEFNFTDYPDNPGATYVTGQNMPFSSMVVL